MSRNGTCAWSWYLRRVILGALSSIPAFVSADTLPVMADAITSRPIRRSLRQGSHHHSQQRDWRRGRRPTFRSECDPDRHQHWSSHLTAVGNQGFASRPPRDRRSNCALGRVGRHAPHSALSRGTVASRAIAATDARTWINLDITPWFSSGRWTARGTASRLWVVLPIP
jgi:hypothetical protein